MKRPAAVGAAPSDVPLSDAAPPVPARCAAPGSSDARRHRRHSGNKKRWAGVCGLIAILCVAGCTSVRDYFHNGCKVGPSYKPPPAPVAADWVQTVGVTRDTPQDCAWWAVFNDATLNGLIETAYRQNLTLAAAGTRILAARAQRNIAVGSLFPQSQGALGAYGHLQLPSAGLLGLPFPTEASFWTTGTNASWEIDFWGRFRRQVESSNASLGAANEDYGDTLVMTLAEVANTYVQLRAFEQRLAFARSNVKIQEGSTQLAEFRFRDGVASELDVRQARAILAQTRALIPQLEVGRRQASNSLCVLLGMPVTDLAGALPPAPIPTAPVQVAVGMPADLLRRRPDVRRAERQVAAQSAQIGVAQADLYPRLAVLGFIGYAANDLNDLFSPKSFIGAIVPNFQWNVLNYGRIVNNIRMQDARLAGSALEYQQSVLSAGREVENALVAFVQSQRQAAELQESVRESQRAVELVIAQFQGGVADFNRVYTNQSQLVTQQDALATALGNIDTNLIQVYRAIGGGWQCFLSGQGLPKAMAVASEGTPGSADASPPEPLTPPPPEAMPTPSR
jgi:NodT family efflux transporter outer membrane factor (OMF) lipoprotein